MGRMPGEDRIVGARVGDLLDELASETRFPGGGAVAALVVAMAAGLCAMAARASRGTWADAGAVAAQAEALRARVTPLAQRNAEAFEAALALLEQPDKVEAKARDHALGEALARAAELPLAIAEAASDVVELGALIATEGDPSVRGDALAAARLAEAAARAAGDLVSLNLGVREDDSRMAVARRLTAAAAEASERAGA